MKKTSCLTNGRFSCFKGNRIEKCKIFFIVNSFKNVCYQANCLSLTAGLQAGNF